MRRHITFMDLEKALNCVDRGALRQVLRIYDVGRRLLKAAMNFHEKISVCVRVNGKLSGVKGVSCHYGYLVF